MLAAAFVRMLPESAQVPARVPLRPDRLLRRAPLRAHGRAALPLRRGDPPGALLRPSAGYLALLGLGVHTLFDGVAIAAGLHDRPVARRAPVHRGVLCTRCPRASRSRRSCSPAASRPGRRWAPARCSACSRSRARWRRTCWPTHHVGYALALSAGVTIYVAASDLIPEVNREGGPALGWTVFGGLVLFAVADWLVSPLGLTDPRAGSLARGGR